MAYCLPPAQAQRFIGALTSGDVDPGKLAQMSSEERHSFLEKLVGKENARPVNSLFESKLLLKNQRQGMVTWAKSVSGLSQPAKRDLITKIQKLDRVLDPAEEESFLADLAATKLGTEVTRGQAQEIANLSKRISETEPKRSTAEQALAKNWSPSAADLEYGRSVYDLQKYVSDLKSNAERFRFSDVKAQNPLKSAGHLVRGAADVSKSIGASLDNSFALRQGIKAFWTNNSAWRKEFLQSFKNIASAAKDTESANREFHAQLMADPHYDEAVRNGLALTKNEDVFPTSLPEKVPGFGRLFGASEVAYNAFAQNLRLNIYKQEMKAAKSLGEDVPKDFGKNMAKMVNSLTGRGGLGRAEPLANDINVLFYSLRFLKSNVDTLFLHPLGLGVEGTAQKKAAKNLVKILAGTAAILGTADALKPGSVDWDPRSANFGKIKVGNTRFDVTGSMGSVAALAAQIVTWSKKSSTTGKVSKFSGAFGQESGFDNVLNFLTNKASPVGGVAVDFAKGKDHTGNTPTIAGELKNIGMPLGIKNTIQTASDDHSANLLAVWLADALGVSANTYGKSQKDWSKMTQPSKEIQTFKQHVNAQDFKKANEQYNKRVTDFDARVTATSQFKGLPEDQKTKVLSQGHAKIQDKVFKTYGFTYKRQQTPQGVKTAKKTLLEYAK